MATTKTRKPTTIYLDETISRAAKLKAATTGMSVSDQVNIALKRVLAEDERDLRLIKNGEHEPVRDYDEFLAEMKRNGQI